MEGLDKTEEPNTREKTAEEYIESKVKDVLCGNGYDEMIYKHDVLEAIRLSKIEEREDVVDKLYNVKEMLMEVISQHEIRLDLDDDAHLPAWATNRIRETLESIENQITELKNG